MHHSSRLTGLSLGALTLALALALTLAAGCRTIPEKDRQSSDIHYDLGIQAQQAGQMQDALAEYTESLRLNPKNPQAHHAMGLLMHHAFGRPDQAEEHFRRALELEPQFTEAKVNLGNLHLDRQRYDQAAKLYEQALADMRYRTPEFAQGNLGWAEYKRGNVEKGINHIKAAVTLNPEFCLGYRNLGSIYDEQGKTEEACVQFRRYREKCPNVADAHYRSGVCLAKLGQTQEAVQRFADCESLAPAGDLKDDCARLGRQLQ
jgi:type IV pilus assembly protein PilF